MIRTARMKRVARLLAGAALTGTMAVAFVPALDTVAPSGAHAKGQGGGGGGQGGGNGGGQGGGNGGGQGGGNGGGNGGGQANGGGHGAGGQGHGRDGVASELGGLNAAHASDRARERANPGSMVGKTAEYSAAMQAELDLGASLAEAHETVAQDLEDAISGLSDLSDEAVETLGDLLGLDDSASETND